MDGCWWWCSWDLADACAWIVIGDAVMMRSGGEGGRRSSESRLISVCFLVDGGEMRYASEKWWKYSI